MRPWTAALPVTEQVGQLDSNTKGDCCPQQWPKPKAKPHLLKQAILFIFITNGSDIFIDFLLTQLGIEEEVSYLNFEDLLPNIGLSTQKEW